MAGLRDQFHYFYAPDEDDIATAIRTGLITPDTNVLLSLYRFQAGARDELFEALEKLGDRLWIPHQVGLEFHRNRLGVMAEQEGYFAQTRTEIGKVIESLYGKVRGFGRRIGMDPDRIENIADGIDMLHTNLVDEIAKAEAANEVRLDGHASDEILAKVTALFEGRVGEPISPDELAEAREEAQRRIKEQVPPGYKDKDKDDPTGDYLVWKQLMQEGKKRKVPVVLVTDDRKEDWYQEFKGRTLGARRELREEMAAQASVPLLVMTTETFLLQAEKYLNIEVSPETVDQAKELSELLKLRNVTAHLPKSATRRNEFLALLDRQIWDMDKSPLQRDIVAHILAFGAEKILPEGDQARREAFAEFLQQDPRVGERDVAAMYIANFLASDQATRDDATQALAWLVAWIATHKGPPGEPPTEE